MRDDTDMHQFPPFVVRNPDHGALHHGRMFGDGIFDFDEAAPCIADLDNDGNPSNGYTHDDAVDINDLLTFLVAFEAGDPHVDLDDGTNSGLGDGGVDINDLIYFLFRFESGC